MTKKYSFQIPYYVYSPEQAYFYIQRLRHYRSLFFKRNKEGGVSGDGLDNIQEIIEGFAGKSEVSPELLEEIIDFLEHIRTKAPRFHMTLADIPDEELKEEVVKWFRSNVHEHTLVTFKHNRSIAGGCIIRSRNKIYNFSFRKKILNPQRNIVQFLEHGQS